MRESLGKYETRRRNESKGRRKPAQVGFRGREAADALPARLVRHVGEAALERTRWDPKDGELCLNRVKPEETLVEARSGSDVQIDRRNWV